MKSDMLSSFAGREIAMRASVYLPASWASSPQKTYPVVYFVTGFGGTNRDLGMMRGMVPREGPESEVIFVVPDPTCFEGHSVFADSANNGPRGAALVKELVEKNARALLANAFGKPDLVGREEFDIQTQVLQRTREKLKALEARIDRLENRPEPPDQLV